MSKAFRYHALAGAESLDRDAVLTDAGLEAMTEAYITALQRFADDHFGEGTVEVVPVSEQHSMGNRNWADTEREQEIIAAIDAQCEVAFQQVSDQPWPTR